MKYFNHWKPTTILGSIILGTGYGFILINDELAQRSDIEIAATMFCGAALFACVMWIFWRYFEAWQLIRRANEPTIASDQTDDLTSQDWTFYQTQTDQRNNNRAF